MFFDLNSCCPRNFESIFLKVISFDCGHPLCVLVRFAQIQTVDRNRSENYEFFQAVSHFKQDPSSNKHAIMEEAKKICNLYVFEAAPLRVALGDGICGSIKQVGTEHRDHDVTDA